MRRVARIIWRQFLKLPFVLRAAFLAGCVGSILIGAFVGNMGLALMGTAVGLSGAGVGFLIGFLAVVAPWATVSSVKTKRPSQPDE